MKYKALALIGLLIASFTAWGQQIFTYEYAVKDTSHLKMDVYVPEKQNKEQSCMVFAFGGGFINGARNDKQIPELMKYYTDRGWVVISIDYRLGLRGYKNLSALSGISKFRKAIEMAGEDLISATDYILRNLLQTPHFSINPSHIVTVGSSAGAITVLQADYFLGNRTHGAELLPDTFHYAGVMSFAGAIFSTQGKVKYRKQSPAPTLLCHGLEDQLVPYRSIEFLNIGLYSSKAIVKRFNKFNYPYYFRKYEGMGHEIAAYYKVEFKLMDEFLSNQVFGQQFLQIDEYYNNPSLPKLKSWRIRPKDMNKN